MTDSTDAQLAAQYEAYPYPARDAREEAKRLIVGSPSHLREIDYWVFGATRPRHTPLNALIAGGGTGDGTIMLATHLARAERPGRVTYLDRSAAAMKVARGRAEARNLTNIDWVQGSLLDLPRLGLGPFDYIDCCGVLHHLPEPREGLAALVSVLAPGGGMGLMVYAPHGRTGVYMVQEALSLLAPAGQAPAARLDVAKRVMKHLPESNWLRFNRNFSDHVTGGDAGLYDLLLNPRDRAFTVSAFAALLASEGMAVSAFMEPMRYDPVTWLAPDPKLRARAAELDATAQAALAEALTANMSVHIAYCRRAAEPVTRADPLSDAAVPIMREVPGSELVKAIQGGGLPFLFDGLRAVARLPPEAPAILHAIDGIRTLAEIAALLTGRGMAEARFRRAWAETFAALQPVNRVLLAPPG